MATNADYQWVFKLAREHGRHVEFSKVGGIDAVLGHAMWRTMIAAHLIDTDEIGPELGRANGRCSKTGLDPGSYRGVTGAMVALDAYSVRGAPKWRADHEMADTLVEQEDNLAFKLRDIAHFRVWLYEELRRWRREVEKAAAAKAAAQRALAQAEADLTAAMSMPDDEENAAARVEAIAAAQAAIDAAQEAIAKAQADEDEAWKNVLDCCHALEILDEGEPPIRYALAKLLSVPEDMGETYQAVYDLKRSGHALPRDLRFFHAPDTETGQGAAYGRAS